MTGCCGTTNLSVSAGKLLDTIPEKILEECPALLEVKMPEDFANVLAINTAGHQSCRADHNELVKLINDLKTQQEAE